LDLKKNGLRQLRKKPKSVEGEAKNDKEGKEDKVKKDIKKE